MDITKDDRVLIDFWDKAFAMTREEREEASGCQEESWRELAPAEKLFNAACSLGARKRVLDYGCGSGWAAIIAAKSGCGEVTAADAAPSAVESARFFASLFGVERQVHGVCITADWLRNVPAHTYDGFICSNVLDVVPPDTAARIISASARAVEPDAAVIIGLNYYLSPRAAEEKGVELVDGRMLYKDGVLRLVSRTDDEWAELFSPYYSVEKLQHFAWPGEQSETRRLFFLKPLRKKTE